jgi:surface protein
MPVSKSNKKYTAPNSRKVFYTKDELQNAVNDWCNNINKDQIIDTYGYITYWKFSKKIWSLEGLFENQATFNEDLSGWNVSNIQCTRRMFNGCVSFLGLGLENWKTYWFYNTEGMFYNCINLICDLSAWNVSNIKYAQYMFGGCSNFNSDLSKWGFKQLTDSGFMFYGCENFNADLSAWNVKNATTMEYMFHNCKNFNRFSCIPWIEKNPNLFKSVFSGIEKSIYALCMLSALEQTNSNLFLHLTLEIPEIMAYM